MSNLALLPPTAHCAVADRVEPYGLIANGYGPCTTLSLDKSGRHVAAGYERGALFVWDLSVRDAAPARAAVAAHAHGVRDVTWLSSTSIATSGGDRSITVWRLHLGRGRLFCRARAAFDGVSLDSYDRSLLAVSTQVPPRVFDCRDLPLGNETEFEVGDRVQARWNGEPTWYVGTLTAVNPYAIDYDDGDHEDDVDASFIRASRLPDPPRYPTPDAAPPTCSTVLEGRDVGALCDAACFVSNDIFAARGEDCWCGEATLKLHGKVKAVASASKHVACACSDGAVRILKVETDIVLLHSLRNPIDKVQFSCPSFGAGGEHLVAAAHVGSQVQFYVWEVQSGHCLARPRDDDKDSQDRGPIQALACHANGAVICTAAAHASQHAIRVWAAPDGFSWRAYAPNFEELHENITYNEREDEFDNTVDSKAPSQPQAELEALLGAHGCNLDDVLRVEATVFDAASGEWVANTDGTEELAFDDTWTAPERARFRRALAALQREDEAEAPAAVEVVAEESELLDAVGLPPRPRSRSPSPAPSWSSEEEGEPPASPASSPSLPSSSPSLEPAPKVTPPSPPPSPRQTKASPLRAKQVARQTKAVPPPPAVVETAAAPPRQRKAVPPPAVVAGVAAAPPLQRIGVAPGDWRIVGAQVQDAEDSTVRGVITDCPSYAYREVTTTTGSVVMIRPSKLTQATLTPDEAARAVRPASRKDYVQARIDSAIRFSHGGREFKNCYTCADGTERRQFKVTATHVKCALCRDGRTWSLETNMEPLTKSLKQHCGQTASNQACVQQHLDRLDQSVGAGAEWGAEERPTRRHLVAAAETAPAEESNEDEDLATLREAKPTNKTRDASMAPEPVTINAKSWRCVGAHAEDADDPTVRGIITSCPSTSTREVTTTTGAVVLRQTTEIIQTTLTDDEVALCVRPTSMKDYVQARIDGAIETRCGGRDYKNRYTAADGTARRQFEVTATHVRCAICPNERTWPLDTDCRELVKSLKYHNGQNDRNRPGREHHKGQHVRSLEASLGAAPASRPSPFKKRSPLASSGASPPPQPAWFPPPQPIVPAAEAIGRTAASAEQPPSECTYEGVSREDGVWVADIKLDGEVKRLGTFATAGAAGRAYDAAREERGLRPMNFPLPGQASPVAEAPAPAADEEAAPPAAFAYEPVEPLTTIQQRAVDTRLRGAKAEERLALHAKLTAEKVPENLVAEQVSALFNRQKAEAEAAVRAEMAEAVAARAIVDAVATEKSRAQPAYPATCEMSDQAIIDELIHVWGYKESTLRTSRNGAWRARASLACWLRQERGEGKAGHPAPATYPAHYGMVPPAQSDPSTADVPSETAVAPISASATQQSSLPAAWPKSGLTERPAAPTPRPPASAAAAPMRAKQPLDAAAPRRSGRTAPRSYTDFSDRDAPKIVAPGPAAPRPHVNLHAMTADGVAPTSVAECALASQPATDPANLALQAQIDKTIVAKVAGREIPNVFAAACGTQLRQVVVTAGGMRCAICALAYSPYVGYVGDKGTKFQAQKAHCGHWNSSNRNERTLAHLDRLLALTSSSPVDRLKALAPVALPPEVELVVPPEQVQAEVRRAQADGWRVEGSSYLGRTVRRTILSETGRPLSCSDGVIRGWLDASRSDFVDSAGRPAALWHVYLATGELAGDEVDLEFSEVLESLVAPPAPPAPAPPPPAAACPEPRPKLPPAPKLDKTNESLWLPRRGDACYSLWRGAWYPAKIVMVVSPDSYEVHYPGWGTQHNHATSRKCLRHKDYDFDLDAHDAPRPAALWTRKPPPCEAPSRKRPRPDDATAESARLRKELDALRAATQRLEQDLRASEARAAELSKQNETTEASILVARRDADEARARATSERQRGDRLEQDLRSQTDLADRYGRQRDEARRAAAALRADVAQLRRERDESRADAAALREKLDDLPRVTPARPAKRGRHSLADEASDEPSDERTEEPTDEARDADPPQVVEGAEDNAWPIVGSHVQHSDGLRGVVTKLGKQGHTEVTTKTGYAVTVYRTDLTKIMLTADEAALCDRSRLTPNEWVQAQLDGAVCAVYEGREFGNCFATKDGRTQRMFTVGTNGDVRCALCDWTAPARASAAMQNDLSAWRKWVDAIKSHCGQFASALKQPATRRHVENVLAMAAEPSTQRDEASPSPTATTDAEVEARDEPVDEARDAALARRLQAEEDAAARPEEEETQLATRPSAKARQEAAAAKAAAYEKARAEEIARTGIAQPPKRPSIPRGLAPSRPDAMGPSNVLRPPTAPRRAAPFPVDSLVEARWRGGRMTYPARVVAVRRNEVDLKYLDGDEEKGVSVALVQPASQRVIARYRAVDTARRPATLPPAPAPAAAAPAKPRAFAKGDQVVAPWSDGRRYAATVVSVGATSTRVAFEDGSQHSVPSDQLESPRLFQKDDAAAAAATPAPAAAAPWQQGVRALSSAVGALREKTPRISFKDLHDTLESHGFSFGCDSAKPPDHFPNCRDLLGKDYSFSHSIRSVPQLTLYLERALGLCGERPAITNPAPPPPKRAPAPPKKPPKKKRARVEAPAAEPCPICLEPLDAAAPALSACGHRIHADCLAGADGSLVSHAWADSKTRTRKGQKVLCPTCRTPSWVAPL